MCNKETCHICTEIMEADQMKYYNGMRKVHFDCFMDTQLKEKKERHAYIKLAQGRPW